MVKIVVKFYPLVGLQQHMRPKDDYFKICADVTGGEIFPITGKSNMEIIKAISGQKVHAHGRGLPFPETSGIFAKKKVYTAHFNVVGISRKSNFMRARLWNRFDKVIALTDYAKKNFIRGGIDPKKVEVLPLPIDYDHYSNLNGGEKFRKKFGLDKDEPFVLVVGLRSGKNIDVIARACELSGVKCVMVGPVEKNEVKSEFGWLLPNEYDLGSKSENVIFTGKLGDQELYQAIDAATIYANSSDHTFECFSLIAHQCAAAGKALCLPDFGVFDKFEGAALFHNNKNPKQLAMNILKYVHDKKLAERNGKKAQSVAKSHDYKNVVKLYERFYNKVGFI
jgi:glycosyltransferase involved in cell wall biosynthesis